MCRIREILWSLLELSGMKSEWALIGSLLFTPATGITLWGPMGWIPGESCTNESFNMYTHLVMLPCYVNISL